MTYDLLFRNTVYGDVAVKGEEIVRVGEAEEDAAQEIDATGLWLLPGGIDVLTHLGLTVGRNSTCDGWELGSAAALAGGTTTVIEHISFDADGSCRAALERAFIQAGNRSCCDYSLHGVVQKVDEELKETLAAAAAEGLHRLGLLPRKWLRGPSPDDMRYGTYVTNAISFGLLAGGAGIVAAILYVFIRMGAQ